MKCIQCGNDDINKLRETPCCCYCLNCGANWTKGDEDEEKNSK